MSKRQPLKIRSRAQILVDALTRELDVAKKAAERAKAEADECAGITSELIAIHTEFAGIVSSKEHGPKTIAALEALKQRDQKARRILKKDLARLLDVQFHAEADRDRVASELDCTKARLAMMREL